VKHDLRSKSVSTKVSEAELRVLESRAERAGLTLSEWVRDVLLGSSVDAGAMMHDYCYAMNGNLTSSANFGGFNAALQGCNQALCNTESQIAAQLNQGITTPTTSRGAAAEAYNEEAAAALQMVSYFSLVARFGNGCH